MNILSGINSTYSSRNIPRFTVSHDIVRHTSVALYNWSEHHLTDLQFPSHMHTDRNQQRIQAFDSLSSYQGCYRTLRSGQESDENQYHDNTNDDCTTAITLGTRETKYHWPAEEHVAKNLETYVDEDEFCLWGCSQFSPSMPVAPLRQTILLYDHWLVQRFLRGLDSPKQTLLCDNEMNDDDDGKND